MNTSIDSGSGFFHFLFMMAVIICLFFGLLGSELALSTNNTDLAIFIGIPTVTVAAMFFFVLLPMAVGIICQRLAHRVLVWFMKDESIEMETRLLVALSVAAYVINIWVSDQIWANASLLQSSFAVVNWLQMPLSGIVFGSCLGVYAGNKDHLQSVMESRSFKRKNDGS